MLVELSTKFIWTSFSIWMWWELARSVATAILNIALCLLNIWNVITVAETQWVIIIIYITVRKPIGLNHSITRVITMNVLVP